MGLVLEGGAMRGVFTCGVLDWLTDNAIRFPYVAGVSAGACNGASYVSGQRGRARYSNIELLNEYNYIGFGHYLKKGNFMDFDLLFHDFPYRILPFDFEAYASAGICFEMVVSNCLTGEAEYLEEYNDRERLLQILRASSSMPFFSPVCYVDGSPKLDGGICDSIPVERCLAKGYDKMVVVLTRNAGYRKKTTGLKIPRFFYKKYPKMLHAVNRRNEIYNKQLECVEQLEKEGKAIVVRPVEPITIKRMEKDTGILTHFYDHGYKCAEQMLKGKI